MLDPKAKDKAAYLSAYRDQKFQVCFSRFFFNIILGSYLRLAF